MPIDYSGGGTLKAFGPKVGESKVIHIRSSERVVDPEGSEDSFKSQTKNWGYHFELTQVPLGFRCHVEILTSPCHMPLA